MCVLGISSGGEGKCWSPGHLSVLEVLVCAEWAHAGAAPDAWGARVRRWACWPRRSACPCWRRCCWARACCCAPSAPTPRSSSRASACWSSCSGALVRQQRRAEHRRLPAPPGALPACCDGTCSCTKTYLTIITNCDHAQVRDQRGVCVFTPTTCCWFLVKSCTILGSQSLCYRTARQA